MVPPTAYILWMFILCCPSAALSDDSDQEVATEADGRQENVDHARVRGASVSARIADGKPARRGDDPWMVGLFMRWEEAKGPFCGGALIGPKFILTAARCLDRGSNRRNMNPFEPESIIARLGAYNWQKNEVPPHRNFNIRQIIYHGDYRKENGTHDIALLVLRKDVPIEDHIGIIRMVDMDQPFNHGTARLTGWGARTRILEDNRINHRLRVFHTKIAEIPYTGKPHSHGLEDKLLVDNPLEGGICAYDWGSPLTVLIEGESWLVGIASDSIGEHCTHSLFSRVAYFLPWIRFKINFGEYQIEYK